MRSSTELIGIIKRYRQLQRHWATFLQLLFEKLTLKAKKLALAGFCLLAGGYSLYLMVKSDTSRILQVMGQGTIKFSNSIHHLIVPKQYPTVVPDHRVPPFKNHSDTIKSNLSGKTR